MSRISTLGGINLIKIDPEIQKKNIFKKGPYDYYHLTIVNSEKITFPQLTSTSIYILSKPKSASISLPSLNASVQVGEVIQIENTRTEIQFTGGPTELIVAETHLNKSNIQNLTLTKNADIYKVTKPWGYELWLNGEHPDYVFKNIFIKSGNKTSLQYHKWKHETNVLFQGKAKLHYNTGNLTTHNISTIELSAMASIDIPPLTIHRIEAISDIVLFEVSTPHLDDVIRLEDDCSRPNGRIAGEHHR